MRKRNDTEVIVKNNGAMAIPMPDLMTVAIPETPEPAFREAARVLRAGGKLVFSDPLNWVERQWWDKYGRSDDILGLLKSCGFTIDTWYDQLLYRELMDNRGSVEEFTTLVIKARKR